MFFFKKKHVFEHKNPWIILVGNSEDWATLYAESQLGGGPVAHLGHPGSRFGSAILVGK